MPRSLRYAASARRDLQELTDWIGRHSDPETAHRYIDAIEVRCASLLDFPGKGRLRRERPAIRSIPFRRAATILYRVIDTEVLILRVLHRGRDVESDLAAPL